MVAPMRFFPNRTWVSIGIVVGLVGILATLAVLQYQWSGEVSQAERERMQASLRAATAQFRQEFGRELQQLGQSFQPDASILANRNWQAFARILTDSLATGDHPLASSIYLWVVDGETGPQLLGLEPESKSFQPVLWPADLEPVRSRYVRTLASAARLPVEIRPNSWTLISGAPLMIHPLILFQPMAGPPSASTLSRLPHDPAQPAHNTSGAVS